MTENTSVVVAGKYFAFCNNLLCIICTKYIGPKLTHYGDIVSGYLSARNFSSLKTT
jgi:hypothetical protein